MKRRSRAVVWGVWSVLATFGGCVPNTVEESGVAGGTAASSTDTSPDGGGGAVGTGGSTGTSSSGGAASSGGGSASLDDTWSLSEVSKVENTSMDIAGGETQTRCAYCPGPEHPVPMAGGFHLSASAVFVQASYPLNWDQPENWSSNNEWQRAGWCATVYNTDSGPHGWDVYMTCRDTSSIDVAALDLSTQTVIQQWEGQGAITSTAHCPDDHPIPWAGGFQEELGADNSKIWLLTNMPVDWAPGASGQGAGWEIKVRGFNGDIGLGPHTLWTSLVCGKTGHFGADDDVKLIPKEVSLPGNWAITPCPEDHPIPLAGGGRSSSTATVLTGSQPSEWDPVSGWGGDPGARWIASADNYDQNLQKVEAIVACRAKRLNETLP